MPRVWVFGRLPGNWGAAPFNNILGIYEDCDGAMFFAGILLVVIFSLLAFIIPLVLGFTLWYGLIFAFLMFIAIDQMIKHFRALCRS